MFNQVNPSFILNVLGERIMIDITEAAKSELTEFFKDKEVKPIRIFLNEGGWGGPSLAMALDEPRDTDHVYKINDVEYLVDKGFMEKAKPITVDFMGMGFKITSGMVIEQSSSCSGCGSTSNCCWFYRNCNYSFAICIFKQLNSYIKL